MHAYELHAKQPRAAALAREQRPVSMRIALDQHETWSYQGHAYQRLHFDDGSMEVWRDSDQATGRQLMLHVAPVSARVTCYEVEDAENPRERGDDDGVEYADPRDARDDKFRD